MENPPEKKQKIQWLIIYALFVIGVVIMHLFMRLDYGDDSANIELTSGFSWFEWVSFRYNAWSSRYIQEMIGYLVLKAPYVWVVLDIIFVSSMPYLLTKITGAKGNERYLPFFLLALYPVLIQSEAGWICTTMTYVWPVFFGLLTFFLFRKLMHSEKTKWYLLVLFYLSMLIASNHELLAVLMICVFIYEAFVMFLKRPADRRKLLIILFAVILGVLNIAIIMMSPGIRTRAAIEVRFFEGYEALSLIKRLYLGINRCVKIFVTTPNALFIIFTAVLAFLSLKRARHTLSKIVCCLPVAFLFVIHIAYPEVFVTTDVYEVYFSDRHTLIILLCGGFMLLFLSFAILVAFRDDLKKGFLNVIVFVVGFATTAAMGLSPTIYASGYRTSIFTYFSLIFVIISLLVHESERVEEEGKKLLDYRPLVIISAVAAGSVSILMVIDAWKRVT
ncbi:MAG: hypothetical protein K6C41_07265 [Lachnospiraceae bacterium]|nr:hypothetical protein [Lachnospiraceae bacterium]